ncbi:DUF4256 domain-containing protein [Candidatus Gracilibacteria bacterium]|nr:DUF4256 domain-containing protein [Candidatus Gracilibacteria bacterium]
MNKLTTEQTEKLLKILESRFAKNLKRHKNLDWDAIEEKLRTNPAKLWSIFQMEETGGEPDVVIFGKEIVFCDCSEESPKGRRSFCYDGPALQSRKEHKPKNSALEMAADMGIEILDETQYRELQTLGEFDTKTSSWIATPPTIRKLGGALFMDRRYDTVFLYHNGAESYYASRAFRGSLRV